MEHTSPTTCFEHPQHSQKLEEKLLFYMQKAIRDFKLIQKGDRILSCLSGGKDSYAMTYLLKKLKLKNRGDWDFQAFTMDQGQPGWDESGLKKWLESENIPYFISRQNTYRIVTEKIPEGKTYCSLCSRMRRGHIYRYAKENGFNKVALGHHRDDLISTLLLSIFYSGQIRSMPPKLLTDDKAHIVIRPLSYVQEKDLIEFSDLKKFPIIPCNLCGSQENLSRKKVKQLIHSLAQDNPKIPSNILHSLQNVQPSQLMDQTLWDFDELDEAWTLAQNTEKNNS